MKSQILETMEEEDTIELTPREKMLARRMRLKRRISDQQELNGVYVFRVKRAFIYAIIAILMLIYNINTPSSAGFAFWASASIFFSFAYDSALKTQQRGKDILSIFKKRLKDTERALEDIDRDTPQEELPDSSDGK